MNRNRITRCLAGMTMASGLLLGGGPVLAQTMSSYGVFCASGRIEIDARAEDQMRSQRGACQFARFSTRSDAENFARRNFKAIGAPCSCR